MPKTAGEDVKKDIRPRQGVALIRESGNQCDTLAGSHCRLRCLIHGFSGLRPLTSWIGNGHPQGVLRSPPFIMSWWTSVLLKCVTPVNPCDIIALYLPFFVPLPRI